MTNSERRISRQRRFLELPGEVRPDWWQLSEVARRMGFADAFAYDGPAAIFREHAALSDHENGGTRDFDIGAYKDISETVFEGLAPFQWPQPAGTAAKDTRFFSAGRFFTEGRKAAFVPTGYRPPRQRGRRFPFLLNTGRIRDQWHTMTRTGKAARLVSHIAEPFAELHPADAARLGIGPADLVEVRSPHGAVLVRALVTDRIGESEVFVPMHWTDHLASSARVDAVVAPMTDPQSGQPGSKFTPVQVEKRNMSWFGFAVLRHRPETLPATYWALAPVEGGYRLEIAGERGTEFERLANAIAPRQDDAVSIGDAAGGWQRLANWRDGALQSAFFFSRNPVEVSRQWACGLLAADPEAGCNRAAVLAGRAPADRPDPGAIVCSCFQVGSHQIEAAARCGAVSVNAIGEQLKAGTNCGSCRSEIQTLLDAITRDERDDTDIAQAS